MSNGRVDPVLISLSTAVALGGFVFFARLGPPDTFWTVDDAGKSLVVANLRADPTSTSLDYPGRRLDPEFRSFPQPLRGSERYAALVGGRVVSQYLSPFTWLALPFAAAAPFVGLGVLPALGAGAAVLLTGLLAATLAGSARAGRVAAGTLVASSPLLFYGAVFWEHSLTTALVAAAFLLLATSPPRPFLAGLSLGAACLLREEAGLLLSAVVLTAVLRARRVEAARIAAGGILGLAARGLFHWATSGTLTGVHAALNPSAPFEHVGEAARDLLIGTGFSDVPLTVAAAALGLLTVGFFLAPRRAAVVALGAGVFALFAISLLGWLRYPGGEDSALALARSNSATLFLPWALAAPCVRRGAGLAPSTRLLGGAALLFLALFVLLVPARSITGVHPGPRMLLPLLPLAAAIAGARASTSRLAAILLAPLLVAGALWNVRSLELLQAKRALAGDLAAAIASRPERVVVTDLFWLPTEMVALWDRKEFHLIASDRDLEELAARAAAAGERSILAAVEPGRIAAAPAAAVQHERFRAFSVDLHTLMLGAEASP